MSRARPATWQVETAASGTSAVSLLRRRGNAADLKAGSAVSLGRRGTLANLPRSTGNAGSSTLSLSLWCRRTMCRRTGLDDRRPSAFVLPPSAFAADWLLLVALDLEEDISDPRVQVGLGNETYPRQLTRRARQVAHPLRDRFSDARAVSSRGMGSALTATIGRPVPDGSSPWVPTHCAGSLVLSGMAMSKRSYLDDANAYTKMCTVNRPRRDAAKSASGTAVGVGGVGVGLGDGGGP